jgi:hypothetical protein
MGNISPFPHRNNARGHKRKNTPQPDKTTKLLDDTRGDPCGNTYGDPSGDTRGDSADPIPSYHAKADKKYHSMRSNQVADKKPSDGWK